MLIDVGCCWMLPTPDKVFLGHCGTAGVRFSHVVGFAPRLVELVMQLAVELKVPVLCTRWITCHFNSSSMCIICWH